MTFNPPNPYWNAQTSSPNQGEGSNSSQVIPVLSREEVIALRECNKESFYYRCIPLSTLFSGLAYIGIKNGILKTNPKFGYVPKMVVGGVIGFIVGKLSYQSNCAEKLMRLPNSQLGATLRKRRGMSTFEESISDEPGFSYDSKSDFQKDKLAVDERRPDLSEHAEGMDSYNTVKENLSPYTENEEALKHEKSTSYDELRRANREEYFNKLSDKYKKQSPDRSPYPSPSFSGGSRFSDSSDSDRRFSDSSGTRLDSGSEPKLGTHPKRNKYGDLWDD